MADYLEGEKAIKTARKQMDYYAFGLKLSPPQKHEAYLDKAKECLDYAESLNLDVTAEKDRLDKLRN